MSSDITLCSPLSKLTFLSTSAITVPDDQCNSRLLGKFDLSAYKYIKSVQIGDTNMYYTKTFMIHGLLELSSIVIGVNSFTTKLNNNGDDPTRSFHISSCKELKSIEIGQYSFSDYGGEFEMKNLPSLQSIHIGNTYDYAYNFFLSSFVLEGIFLFQGITLRFPQPAIHNARPRYIPICQGNYT